MRWWAGLLLTGAIWPGLLAGCGDDGAGTGGTTDAAAGQDGNGAPDAGAVDAAGPDAAWDPAAPALACDDAPDDVYLVPAGLPAMTDATRGDVVRCAREAVLDQAGVQDTLGLAGVGAVSALSGAHQYRIAYRTMTRDGTAVVSSARVYLPSSPRRTPVPIVAVAHPSVGLADACAPTRDPLALRDIALPWAARGFAVIAPDFSGLGGEGVQAYLDNMEQGRQLLDGARALRKLLAPGLAADEVLVLGYSQGGGAALSAQAIEHDYGSGGTLVGAIAFAPEWPTRANSFRYVEMLRDPGMITIFTGLSFSTVAVLRQYEWFAAAHGVDHALDAFPAALRPDLGQAIESQCLIGLGGFVQTRMLHTGDLVDDALREGLLSCIDGGACVEPARGYWEFLQANVLHGDPAGAPVLVVQGLADQILPAGGEAACNVDALLDDGVAVDVCVDGLATHATIVTAQVGPALAWGEAVLDGQPRPECASHDLPACVP